MKLYRVIVEPPAIRQIEQYHGRAVAAAGKPVADRWFNRLQAAILSLATMPARLSAVPEQADFAEPLRQLVFGRGYRVVFTIRGDAVHVLCVRGLGLPPLRGADIKADGELKGKS